MAAGAAKSNARACTTVELDRVIAAYRKWPDSDDEEGVKADLSYKLL